MTLRIERNIPKLARKPVLRRNLTLALTVVLPLDSNRSCRGPVSG